MPICAAVAKQDTYWDESERHSRSSEQDHVNLKVDELRDDHSEYNTQLERRFGEHCALDTDEY